MTRLSSDCGCEWEEAPTGAVVVRADCPDHGGQLVSNACPCGCQESSVPQWWRDYSAMVHADRTRRMPHGNKEKSP